MNRNARLPKFPWPGLPKWPGLLVVGDHVTPDQAAIINVRTSMIDWMTNNTTRQEALNKAIGITAPDPYDFDDYGDRVEAFNVLLKQRKAAQQRYRIIGLNNLHNYNTVFAGVLHGWCAWNGDVGCHTWNIGKWPSADDVYRDWRSIAAAFPFLNLTCQLLSEEACMLKERPEARPLIEYRISRGKVKVSEPTKLIVPREKIVADCEERLKQSCARLYGNRDENHAAECGCTIEQFERALELTEASFRQ